MQNEEAKTLEKATKKRTSLGRMGFVVGLFVLFTATFPILEAINEAKDNYVVIDTGKVIIRTAQHVVVSWVVYFLLRIALAAVLTLLGLAGRALVSFLHNESAAETCPTDMIITASHLISRGISILAIIIATLIMKV